MMMDSACGARDGDAAQPDRRPSNPATTDSGAAATIVGTERRNQQHTTGRRHGAHSAASSFVAHRRWDLIAADGTRTGPNPLVRMLSDTSQIRLRTRAGATATRNQPSDPHLRSDRWHRWYREGRQLQTSRVSRAIHRRDKWTLCVFVCGDWADHVLNRSKSMTPSVL